MFHINAQSDVPVYRQLVDEIRSAIRAGRLAAGAQLPTVLAMAEDLGLARGTIKRAYDELELLGLVEKVQGRGTFVCYRPPAPAAGRSRPWTSLTGCWTAWGSWASPRRRSASFWS